MAQSTHRSDTGWEFASFDSRKRRTVERAKEISHRIPVGEEGADMVLGKAKRSINKLAIFCHQYIPDPNRH